jgi:hypothetical protein
MVTVNKYDDDDNNIIAIKNDVVDVINAEKSYCVANGWRLAAVFKKVQRFMISGCHLMQMDFVRFCA